MPSSSGNSRRQMVELLAQQIRGLEGARQADFGEPISSGCPGFDQIETATGRRYWLFRRLDDRRRFLHGWFE